MQNPHEISFKPAIPAYPRTRIPAFYTYRMTDQTYTITFACFSGSLSLISRHITDYNISVIFARHFLQSSNIEGSWGRIVCGCARDWRSRVASCLCSFPLTLCLFKTLVKGEAICFVLYSNPNATLFCECVSSDKHSSWAIIVMFVG